VKDCVGLTTVFCFWGYRRK